MKILIFAPYNSPFISTDIELLKAIGQVTSVISSGVRAIVKIVRLIPFHTVTIFWFGTVYSAIGVLTAKIFRKKVIIILAGVDMAKIPEINYGIWLSRWRSVLMTYALRNADVLLGVTPTFKERAKQLAKYNAENFYYLPFGFDASYWKPGNAKEKMVLSIGHALDNTPLDEADTRLKKKGFDFLFEAARQMPNTPFVIIGFDKTVVELLGYVIPENITLLRKMSQPELLAYYQRAAVFCQPSRTEGMPNTLCEAMACGCIPVGSDADGIPEAIGDTGFVVPVGNILMLIDALEKALQQNFDYGLKARTRIMDEFTVTRRSFGLQEAVYRCSTKNKKAT